MVERIILLGAGGRDFHVFNTRYRHDPTSRVVAFTATQIPHIADRSYPPVLAGALYPDGIPIRPEEELESLIREGGVDEVVFAYSDVSMSDVQRLAERVEGWGARFGTFDIKSGLLPTTLPSVAVCAVRTGCGKSGVSRHLSSAIRNLGRRVAVLRHPMPYGHLENQVLQRFETIEDLSRHACTLEEREEYEPHLVNGSVVFAGADYLKILGVAESESDVVLWDGGNNDGPFVEPDVLVTLLDPLRAGDEAAYFPSRWNVENADVLVVAKTDHATAAQIERVLESASRMNADADVVLGRSPYSLDRPDTVAGKRVLVLEDGPTITHGGMGYGAGLLAARAGGASAIVDPRPYAFGEIAETFERYPHIQEVLPALGYGQDQLEDLERTIDEVECDVVVIGTPIDLSRVVDIRKPVVRASYSYADAGDAHLADVVLAKLFGEPPPKRSG